LQNPTISIENVSFSYPRSDRVVLDNINLNLEFGTNVALIGPNGAGKSTLVKLLLRIYDPTEGRILINGVNIKELPESVLYSLFSTLFQNFARLHLTIKNNLEIAAGEDLNREEAIKFLKFASIWDHIKDLPNDINQQLGPEYKDGTDFSGGQWQRLAIARAYAKSAPVLILDEPTSAVDVESEIEIFDKLNKQLMDNTLIFISHRFSTIKDAERIIVLKKGKVVEDGNHKELMKDDGLYADLYNLQVQRFLRKETQTKLLK
jgi:ATP-binding cassette subfamily B protein